MSNTWFIYITVCNKIEIEGFYDLISLRFYEIIITMHNSEEGMPNTCIKIHGNARIDNYPVLREMSLGRRRSGETNEEGSNQRLGKHLIILDLFWIMSLSIYTQSGNSRPRKQEKDTQRTLCGFQFF